MERPSQELKKLYNADYFIKKVEGHKEYKKGMLHWKKVWAANHLDFPGKVVLDMGAGRGDMTKYMTLYGAKRVIAIDYSLSACNIISYNMHGLDYGLYCYSMDDIVLLTEEPKIELIYMIDILEHVGNDEISGFLGKLPDIAIKEVEFFGMTPAEPQGDYKGMHCNYHTYEGLVTLFTKYFFNVQISVETFNKKHYTIKCKGLK